MFTNLATKPAVEPKGHADRPNLPLVALRVHVSDPFCPCSCRGENNIKKKFHRHQAGRFRGRKGINNRPKGCSTTPRFLSLVSPLLRAKYELVVLVLYTAVCHRCFEGGCQRRWTLCKPAVLTDGSRPRQERHQQAPRTLPAAIPRGRAVFLCCPSSVRMPPRACLDHDRDKVLSLCVLCPTAQTGPHPPNAQAKCASNCAHYLCRLKRPNNQPPTRRLSLFLKGCGRSRGGRRPSVRETPVGGILGAPPDPPQPRGAFGDGHRKPPRAEKPLATRRDALPHASHGAKVYTMYGRPDLSLRALLAVCGFGVLKGRLCALSLWRWKPCLFFFRFFSLGAKKSGVFFIFCFSGTTVAIGNA